jgi:hypothetical protein
MRLRDDPQARATVEPVLRGTHGEIADRICAALQLARQDLETTGAPAIRAWAVSDSGAYIARCFSAVHEIRPWAATKVRTANHTLIVAQPSTPPGSLIVRAEAFGRDPLAFVARVHGRTIGELERGTTHPCFLTPATTTLH